MCWCQAAAFSGWARKARKAAVPLYSSAGRFGAVIAHRLAPPMMELIGG